MDDQPVTIRLLVGFAEERIFGEHSNVFICVSSFNPGAKRLYKIQDYKVIGLLDDYVVYGCFTRQRYLA